MRPFTELELMPAPEMATLDFSRLRSPRTDAQIANEIAASIDVEDWMKTHSLLLSDWERVDLIQRIAKRMV